MRSAFAYVHHIGILVQWFYMYIYRNVFMYLWRQLADVVTTDEHLFIGNDFRYLQQIIDLVCIYVIKGNVIATVCYNYV